MKEIKRIFTEKYEFPVNAFHAGIVIGFMLGGFVFGVFIAAAMKI